MLYKVLNTAKCIMFVDRILDVRTVCFALATIEYKWLRFGVQLGIPRHVLKKFENERDPLSAVVDYWLRGNVKDVPRSWRYIVDTLKSDYVDEGGLSRSIEDQYCCVKKDFEMVGCVCFLLYSHCIAITVVIYLPDSVEHSEVYLGKLK